MADILTLDDARKALRLPAANTSNNADLEATYIPATTAVVEDVVGPQIALTGLTYAADGGGAAILLPTAVAAVTGVIESGATLAPGDWFVDADAGLLYRGSSTALSTWAPGIENVTVTYNVGGTVPQNVVLAARIILAHLWSADQEGDRPDFGNGSDEIVATPSGFAIPRRALQLLAPSDDLPGFA